ncbi:CD276 antigen homolog isoform X2 [Poecilia formosa]|uniref:CD276 antigen homolog isoform X2 n=1 Tax=Poecilia formosa TaxID=48698 RepID=UPI0004440D16|nr:PREDICTED: CD276 antigen homolog isoform X2 [Poecilia formosa]
MAARQAVVWTFLLLSVSMIEAPPEEVISAEPGQPVTLPCKANGSEPVTAVEWNRADLETEHVLLYRRGKGEDPASQNPSYKNRASLKDEQMKDGDMSLVLKNVKPNDTGTYQCRLEKQKQKQAFGFKPVCSVQLVLRPGTKDGLKNEGRKNDGLKNDGVKNEGSSRSGNKFTLLILLVPAVWL